MIFALKIHNKMCCAGWWQNAMSVYDKILKNALKLKSKIIRPVNREGVRHEKR